MLDFIGTMATSALMVLVVAALTVALKMSNPGKLTFAMIGGLWIGFAAASAQAGSTWHVIRVGAGKRPCSTNRHDQFNGYPTARNALA